MKVLHIAYRHIRNDIRIAQKEGVSLAKNGYEVFYTSSDHDENRQVPEGIEFIPLRGKNSSILVNYFINQDLKKEYCSIIEHIQPQIVHIHEYGISYLVKLIKRKYKNIKVIYDAHEDNVYLGYEHDIAKYGRFITKIVTMLRANKEHQACRNADLVIAATPHIEELLKPYSKKIVTIKNYAIIDQLSSITRTERSKKVCYVGGMTKKRGITTLVGLSPELIGELYLAGPVDEHYMQELIRDYKETYQSNWFYKGNLTREEVDELYSTCSVGVCVFKKAKNYIYALPTKIFEYMRAGLPVIVSDFPLWREIVEGAQCGFCVDEEDPRQIAEKVNYLFSHPEEASRMGANGRQAVLEKYNWGTEEKKLLQLYRELF